MFVQNGDLSAGVMHSGREIYVTPRFKRLGDLRDITLGASAGTGDSPSSYTLYDSHPRSSGGDLGDPGRLIQMP
jgi:hypothetical protein